MTFKMAAYRSSPFSLLQACSAACRRTSGLPSRLVPRATVSRAAHWGTTCSARTYSSDAGHAPTQPAGISPENLQITRTIHPKPLEPPESLVFGRTFTGLSFNDHKAEFLLTVLDHMLAIEWTSRMGWLVPQITPYQNLSLDPATCVFHYAFECFEGMKAYKDAHGNIRLFRPDKNMARMNKSAARIALPTFEPSAMIDLIARFVYIDDRFIPEYVPSPHPSTG